MISLQPRPGGESGVPTSSCSTMSPSEHKGAAAFIFVCYFLLRNIYLHVLMSPSQRQQLPAHWSMVSHLGCENSGEERMLNNLGECVQSHLRHRVRQQQRQQQQDPELRDRFLWRSQGSTSSRQTPGGNFLLDRQLFRLTCLVDNHREKDSGKCHQVAIDSYGAPIKPVLQPTSSTPTPICRKVGLGILLKNINIIDIVIITTHYHYRLFVKRR